MHGNRGDDDQDGIGVLFCTILILALLVLGMLVGEGKAHAGDQMLPVPEKIEQHRLVALQEVCVKAAYEEMDMWVDEVVPTFESEYYARKSIEYAGARVYADCMITGIVLVDQHDAQKSH